MSLPFPEYDTLDGVALADLVRRREVTAAEVTEAALARIATRNPALNAVVRPLPELARQMASSIPVDAPLAGVPLLVKDLMATIAGVPTSHGTRALQQLVPAADSELIARYRRAGAVFVGKGNTPELGLTPTTESAALGPARNPWDLTRTTGGSSGGAGAAVAARMVPVAHGGDGGGSIRIPAAACGVFGLKPSRGRTPTGPVLGDVWHGFVQEHVLSRSVRDSAAFLDASAGMDPGAPVACPPQARPYLEEVTRDPGPLRIAVTASPFFGRTVHPDCVAALDDAAALLSALGHEVRQDAPVLDGAGLARDFVTVVAVEARGEIDLLGEQLRRPLRRTELEPATWALATVGAAIRGADYVGAVRRLQQAARTVGAFFETVDVLVTPTLAQPPVPLGTLKPTGVEEAALRVLGALGLGRLMLAAGLLEQTVDKVYAFIPHTPLFNVTGQPAMSVPLFWNAQGLPIGTQCVARLGEEDLLFRLAGQLERARPWADRRPPLLR
jgi:amidase